MKILLEQTFDNIFVDTIAKCILYAFLGLMLGIIVNMISVKTSKIFNVSRFFNVFIQLIYCAVTFAYIKTYVSERLVDRWINSMQGLFFVSVFFGVQYGMFSNIQSYMDTLVKLDEDFN